MPVPTIAIALDTDLAGELPADPADCQEVVVLGLKELRLRRAFEACRRGEVSLARAAELAGVSLREAIPLAYAHGLVPPVPPELRSREHLSLEEAALL